ncbi:hypothetical protein [Mycolicibacterium fluoranthenivorans]|uniref:Uncharacterized protein n=1 Tax=Mycolicibacterium fluoranthenivorans TaxID=258505 RepID=A0A7X5TXZ5_9MYCO|nr:hypothetical protein [Mycolicibacterium fluoranthenivorans]NIH94790.1 hypothetical protein [Mycolicibacterium fluoranthenivorans]
MPSPALGACVSGPGRGVAVAASGSCAAAGFTGACGERSTDGPAPLGAWVRGYSGVLPCGVRFSGLRAGVSGAGVRLGASVGPCMPPAACGAIGMPPIMGAGAECCPALRSVGV